MCESLNMGAFQSVVSLGHLLIVLYIATTVVIFKCFCI